MNPISVVKSRAVVLPEENIDTDRIIPARFLTTTSSDGLGAHVFCDWRYASDGSLDASFPLNRPEAKGAEFLVAGRNFGCGSSREHAAWALGDLGIRVVISSEIADIFRANAGRNGILPIEVDEASHRRLLGEPFGKIEVDLRVCQIRTAAGDLIRFEIDPFMRRCLLDGVDHLGYLLKSMDAIEAYEAANTGGE